MRPVDRPGIPKAPLSRFLKNNTRTPAAWQEIVRFFLISRLGPQWRAFAALRDRRAGLTEVQLVRLVCPIGAPGLESKDPAVIAASTAAQLLIVSEKLAGEEDEARGARRRSESPTSAL